MIKDRNLIIAILLFIGIFLFKMPIEKSICITPQMTYLIFGAGLLGYLCLKKLNKYMGFLFLIAVLMTCKTYLGDKVSRHYLQEDAILGMAMFGIYYATRVLNIKQDMLKFLMFPALVNFGFVFIQKFIAKGAFPFPKEITGIVSNGGFTSCFLALTIPVFFKYFKWGLIPVFLAMIWCNGFTGIIAGIIPLLFLLYFTYFRGKKRLFIGISIIPILSLVLLINQNLIKINNVDFSYRMSAYIGTLDGIKQHFVNGWGVGSFTSIMARVKPENSRYYNGVAFNDTKTILNHPHNEFLYYWWSVGLVFMVGIVFLIKDYLKKLCPNNIMPFAILLSAFISMNGYQLMPPSLFVLMFTMAIFENEFIKKEVKNGCQDDGQTNV